MLRHLTLREFALVESLDLEFGPGLCLLTGETGAGKSILVEALGLLSGRRADVEMVREGSDEACVEGVFDPAGEGAALLLRQWDLPPSREIVIRRRVSRSGRGAATVNGAQVSIAQLKSLGEALLEIHGQHQGQSLLDEESHRELLDGLGEVRSAAETTRSAHSALSEALAALRTLRHSQAERARRLDAVKFQREEIARVAPVAGEEEELRAQRSRLQNASGLAENAAGLQELLRDGEQSAAALLAEARKRALALSQMDPEWQAYLRDLDQAAGILASLGAEAERVATTTTYDPEALERTEERLAGYERLKRKYGPEVEDVLKLQDELEAEYRLLTSGPESEVEAAAKVEFCFQSYLREARRLTACRRGAAKKLGGAVESEMRPLALEKGRFEISLRPLDCASPLEARATGLEEVTFTFSANPGEGLKPLSKIASGGELSRVMLALLSAARLNGGPSTAVFDEVDAGIGGRPAEAVGKRLKLFSRSRQVLCITHLPQIAAWADHHIFVEKRPEKGRTRVLARPLSPEERREELARMLAGETVTETARRHAEALLQSAATGD